LNGIISRTLDGSDRITSEITSLGTVTYTYDAAGRRTAMTAPGQPQVTYGYDAANRLTNVTQGASTVTIAYDDANRRSVVNLPNGTSVEYGYDNASQLTGLTYKQGTTVLGTLTYTYDLAGRRTQTGGTWARTGLPQPVTSAAYDAANRLTQWAVIAPSHDASGNFASDGLNSYVWDARNQLTAVSGPIAASFQYDALRRRRTKILNGQSTEFVHD